MRQNLFSGVFTPLKFFCSRVLSSNEYIINSQSYEAKQE